MITGEFWTARQRQMHSLHYVVSYRASFKPELPQYFIEHYSKSGDTVFDPFGGRGTTMLQANLMGRFAIHNDVNPISTRIAKAKASPFAPDEVAARLASWDFSRPVSFSEADETLLAFYHPDTLRELLHLRRCVAAQPDDLSRFIELVALSRLHGHSDGFFSVYTFPQISVPVKAQARINASRRQRPEYRELKTRILRKARQIVKSGGLAELRDVGRHNLFSIADSRRLRQVPAASADLLVTSPPFLDKVDYVQDNWLKCWFLGISPEDMRRRIVQTRDLDEWRGFLRSTLQECARVVKPGGRAVIEVGEVEHRGERLNLDEIVRQLSEGTGFVPETVLIHSQKFTKLANCFHVDNNEKGTNTHRCVILRNAG